MISKEKIVQDMLFDIKKHLFEMQGCVLELEGQLNNSTESELKQVAERIIGEPLDKKEVKIVKDVISEALSKEEKIKSELYRGVEEQQAVTGEKS